MARHDVTCIDVTRPDDERQVGIGKTSQDVGDKAPQGIAGNARLDSTWHDEVWYRRLGET